MHYVAGLEDDGGLREFELDAEFFHPHALDLVIGRSRALSPGTRPGRLRRLSWHG